MNTTSYTKIGTSKRINTELGTIEINKFKKVGTSRIFWTPELNDTRIVKTMFGQMGEAVKTARAYTTWKLAQSE